MFGSVATSYEDARPDYPDRVFEVLRERCGLRAFDPRRGDRCRLGKGDSTAFGSGCPRARDRTESTPRRGTPRSVLYGASTGHRRRPLRRRPHFAVVIRSRGRRHSISLAGPGTDTPEDRLDPAARRVAGVVVETCSETPTSRIHSTTRPSRSCNDLEPSPSEGRDALPFALNVSARTSELEGSGFHRVAYEALRWTLTLDSSQTRRLYGTYSNIARLPTARREAILDGIERVAAVEFGGRVERQMVTPIYTARTGST